MIICGYPGIGKSSIAGENGCIDLESCNFWVDGRRDPDWAEVYCNIAHDLSEQGYTVFVSSHTLVQNELKKYKDEVFLVFPALDLKEQWIERTKKRFDADDSNKNLRALENVRKYYEDNIKDMMSSGLSYYEISHIDYDLRDVVKHLKGEE